MDAPYRVLFVCGGNACQSQVAEGWLRHLGGERVVARSAGVRPRPLHPLATRAMQEVGVDVSAQRGKGLEAVRHERFDLLVTLCEEARAETLELVRVAQRAHRETEDPTWLEEDPSGDLDAFRALRDELRAFVEELLGELGS